MRTLEELIDEAVCRLAHAMQGEEFVAAVNQEYRVVRKCDENRYELRAIDCSALLAAYDATGQQLPDPPGAEPIFTPSDYEGGL